MNTTRILLLTFLLSISFVLAAHAQNANKVTSQHDIPYVSDGDPKHRLDIYFPAQRNKPLAVLFHIHGGGWKTGDKQLMKATGLFYASQGFLFVTPNYRLSPEAMHPAHVEDCAAALAWVFLNATELGIDRNRMFISGHSAGAHLAALLGTNPRFLLQYNLVPGDLAGVIPVDTASFNLLTNDNERYVKRLIENAFGGDKQTLLQASPFYNITPQADYPRFLVLNTTNRESAAREAEAFTDKLRSAGCDARFVAVDDHTHGEMARGMHDASDPVGAAILRFIKGDE